MARDRLRVISDSNREMRTIERLITRILTKPTEVREISDQICDLHLHRGNKNEDGGRGAVDDGPVAFGADKRFSKKGAQMLEKELREIKFVNAQQQQQQKPPL